MSLKKYLLGMSFVFLSLCFTACTLSAPDYGPELIRPASARVDIARIDRGPVVELARHMGITRYISEVVYFTNPVGPFAKFYVSPGDTVVEGQLLARLDTEYLEEQIANRIERIANMRSDNALTIELREIAIDIMVAENARNFVATAEAADISGAEAAEARILAIEMAQLELRQERDRQSMALRHEEDRLQTLRSRLAYAELTAPFDGIITFMDDIRPGQYVGVARPLIYMSNQNETIVELVGLTGHDFPAVMVGGPITWRPFAVRDAIAIHAHIDDQVYDLEFIVTPSENRHFRPVQFEILQDVVLSVGKLFPIDFYTTKIDDVVRVPANAVFSTPGGFFVYKMVNGEPIHTEIEIITRTTSFIAVASGLEVGDEVFVRP